VLVAHRSIRAGVADLRDAKRGFGCSTDTVAATIVSCHGHLSRWWSCRPSRSFRIRRIGMTRASESDAPTTSSI
jgi:hypothetical protein